MKKIILIVTALLSFPVASFAAFTTTQMINVGTSTATGIPYIDGIHLNTDPSFLYQQTIRRLWLGNNYIEQFGAGFDKLRLVGVNELDLNPGPGAVVYIRDSAVFGATNTFDLLGNCAIGAIFAQGFPAPSSGCIIEGYVGIGTTSPGTRLSIGDTGGINLSDTGTSTLGSSVNGLNLTRGCFAIRGTCVTGGGSGSGTVNSGTANQVTYYAANGTAVSGTSTISMFPQGGTYIYPGADSGTNKGAFSFTVPSLNSLQFSISGPVQANSGFDWRVDSSNNFIMENTESADMKMTTGVSGSLTLKPGGNFGIGSTTPGTKLSIGTTNGINISDTGTSTFGSASNGINITNGCYAVNGTCVGSGSGSGTVSGTINQVAKFTSATAVGDGRMSDNGSQIFFGNAANNVSAPVIAPLNDADTGIDFSNSNVINFVSGGFSLIRGNAGVDMRFNTSNTDTDIEFKGVDSSLQTLNLDAGNSRVGIRTSNTPSNIKNPLDVNGSAVFGSGYAETVTAPPDSILIQKQIGIGTTSPYAALSVVGSTGVVAGKYVATSTVDASTIASNLGIGTTSPYAKLSIQVSQAGDAFALASTTNAGATANATTYKIDGKDGHTTIGYDQKAANTYVDDNDSNVLTLNYQSYNPGAPKTIFSTKNRAGSATFCVNDQGGIMAGNQSATCTMNTSFQAANFLGAVLIANSAFGGDAGFQVQDRTIGTNGWQFYSSGGKFRMYDTTSASDVYTFVPTTDLFGVGTSTPWTKFSVNTNNKTTNLIGLATTSGRTLFTIDPNGHKLTGGIAPTCGAGCGAVSGDDSTMIVTTGSSVSSSVVNFAATWTNEGGSVSITPVCHADEENAGVVAVNASSTPTTVTLEFASALTTRLIAVSCQASNNATF